MIIPTPLGTTTRKFNDKNDHHHNCNHNQGNRPPRPPHRLVTVLNATHLHTTQRGGLLVPTRCIHIDGTALVDTISHILNRNRFIGITIITLVQITIDGNITQIGYLTNIRRHQTDPNEQQEGGTPHELKAGTNTHLRWSM